MGNFGDFLSSENSWIWFTAVVGPEYSTILELSLPEVLLMDTRVLLNWCPSWIYKCAKRYNLALITFNSVSWFYVESHVPRIRSSSRSNMLICIIRAVESTVPSRAKVKRATCSWISLSGNGLRQTTFVSQYLIHMGCGIYERRDAQEPTHAVRVNFTIAVIW